MVPPAAENPYAAPKAQVRQPRRERGQRPLASRLSRLMAVILDSVVGFVIAIPGYFFMSADDFSAIDESGEFDFSGGIPGSFLVIGALLLAFAILQIFLLVTRSQTVGKIMMGIRVDEYGSDERAGPVKTILIRGLAVGVISSIPLIGAIFALVNILFIFGKEQRCIHDLMAGTVVRKAP